GGLLAEIHGGEPGADSILVRTLSACSPNKSTTIKAKRGTTISRSLPIAPNHINGLRRTPMRQLSKISQGQMPPHVRRGGTRGRSNTPRHAAQARAGLSAGRSAPRTQGKFAAFDEFCNRLYVDVMPSSSSGGESKRQTRWSYCNGLNPQNFDPKIIKKYAFCNWRRFEVFIPMDSSHSWCTNKSLLERWFSNGTLRRVI